MIARRGPVQAAFTPPEARELLELEQTVTLVDPEVLKLDPASENVLQTTKYKDVVRNIEIMRKMAQFSGEEKPRQLYLMFQYSPVEILEEDGRVSGIKLVKNELLQDEGGRIKARPVDEFEELPVGLVFRSIGMANLFTPEKIRPREPGQRPQSAGGGR
jgi:ferredoxin--NADP+ reductase